MDQAKVTNEQAKIIALNKINQTLTLILAEIGQIRVAQQTIAKAAESKT